MYRLLFFLILDKIKIVTIDYGDTIHLKCTKLKGSIFTRTFCDHVSKNYEEALEHNKKEHYYQTKTNEQTYIKLHETVYGNTCKFIHSFFVSKKGYNLFMKLIETHVGKHNFYNYIDIPYMKKRLLYLDTFVHDFNPDKVFEKPKKMTEKEKEYIKKYETLLAYRETYQSDLADEMNIKKNNSTSFDDKPFDNTIRPPPDIIHGTRVDTIMTPFVFEPMDYFSIEENVYLPELEKEQYVNDLYSDVPYFLEYNAPENKETFIYFNSVFNTIYTFSDNVFQWNLEAFPEFNYIDLVSKTCYDKLTTIIDPRHETTEQDIVSILKILTNTSPLHFNKVKMIIQSTFVKGSKDDKIKANDLYSTIESLVLVIKPDDTETVRKMIVNALIDLGIKRSVLNGNVYWHLKQERRKETTYDELESFRNADPGTYIKPPPYNDGGVNYQYPKELIPKNG